LGQDTYFDVVALLSSKRRDTTEIVPAIRLIGGGTAAMVPILPDAVGTVSLPRPYGWAARDLCSLSAAVTRHVSMTRKMDNSVRWLTAARRTGSADGSAGSGLTQA
jgi:hypothetical protein